MSGSTPHKYSSRQATASLEIPSATRRLQSNLKHAMEEEIADQTFWLPSLELSRILSPKKPKSGVVEEFLQLDDCDCIVDKQPFEEALKDVVTELKTFTPSAGSGESASYRSLAEFLTGCVKACHVALDKRTEFPLRQDRWYKDLEFTVGKPVVDSVDGTASLKPDITGGNGILALTEERLYWKPPADKSTHRVTLPVEVKKQWKDMVSQAATYARCLFSASPMRIFVLVLAFNQESNMLRFLVFHRGGLTASEEHDITRPYGLQEIARLFLTLASWSTAQDAGVITCYSENVYLLPGNKEGASCVCATADGILSRSLCVRGRTTYVSRLRLPTNTIPVALKSPGKKLPKPRERGKGEATVEERLPGPLRTGAGLTTRSASRKTYPPLVVQEQTDDGQVQANPDVQLKYVQPKEIVRSKDDPVLSELTGTVVIKTSWPGIDRRDNEARMYRDSAGRFGTIPHVCSYEGVGEHHEVISNILFVPKEHDIREYHWPIFSNTPPKKPDIRTFRLNVFGVEGKSLIEARDPQQLSRALAHFLLGWLLTYLSGHLHRDVSLGNALLTDEPIKRKKFEIPGEFLQHVASLQDREAAEEIKKLCEQVGKLVDELGISDQCTGFVTDGDLAIPWREYWTEGRRATKSGTPEFMSRKLLNADGNHLHSPVDDLESCFWVSVWSVLFNKDNTGDQSDEEKSIRTDLIDNNKDSGMYKFTTLSRKGKHSAIMKCFRSMLSCWWEKVGRQHQTWSDDVLDDAPENADGEYYLPHFHRFALQGVVDVLQVLKGHWDGEVSWKSWTAPAPSK